MVFNLFNDVNSFLKLTSPKQRSDCTFGKGQGDPEAESTILNYRAKTLAL